MTAPDADPGFEALVDHLRAARGFDFSGYKRTSLMRRFRKRLDDLGLAAWTEYADYLEVHAEEFDTLFDTILINVTAFFRDPEAWAYLAEHVLPALAGGDGPLRVWSAGCSTGEEAYTLAILLAEALGDDGFRRRVKIYATDADEEALGRARVGVYPPGALADVPVSLRGRYFEPAGEHLAFRSDLRRAVIFGRHDLTRDAPISRLDLLVCRNTLMYFNAETQAGIARRLHFALNPGATLFLGKAEMLLSRAAWFAPLSTHHRIFAKLVAAEAELPGPPRLPASAVEPVAERLRLAAFAASSAAVLVVSRNGQLTGTTPAARTLLGLVPPDEGRALRDLEVSYRPVELRGAIDRVVETGAPVRLAPVERTDPTGQAQWLEVTVAPLVVDGVVAGAGVTFADVTQRRVLEAELQRARQELETTNEELQSTVEELETTNEELQSTNEELETTNEELQSTNEELETTNEELRSSNEELGAINDALRARTSEADEASGYLVAIVDSMRDAVIVLDAELRVRTWNRTAEEMWGLRSSEAVGAPLAALDFGLRTELLDRPMREALVAGVRQAPIEVDSLTRRGRAVRCQVVISPLVAPPGAAGLLVVVEELPPRP